MGKLLGMYNGERNDSSQDKILRDKAYTYLKEIVDEARRVGRFVYRQQPDKLDKYQRNYKNSHR